LAAAVDAEGVEGVEEEGAGEGEEEMLVPQQPSVMGRNSFSLTSATSLTALGSSVSRRCSSPGLRQRASQMSRKALVVAAAAAASARIRLFQASLLSSGSESLGAWKICTS